MFGIFKKQKVAVIDTSNIGKTSAILEISNKYSKEVLEIHNEFEIAADKLLAEANSIIQEAGSKNINKVNRLQSLGFKQVKEVEELTPLLKKAELSKEQIELVNYYKREYPFNKFITEEQVKEICHKYNLVCGNVDRFTGFVPEKNLKEIESFKLKEKDKLSDLVIFHTDTGKIENFNADKYLASDKNFILNKYIKTNTYTYVSTPEKSEYIGAEGYVLLVDVKKYTGASFKEQYNNKIGLKICAPVKDMDISGLELIEGYKLEKKFIPDPVVLQPVDGGYLVLTKWGPEASDPILLNEIDN